MLPWFLRRFLATASPKAETLMMEVHRQGRSIVWTGGREKAELYVQQLHGWQIQTTMEKTG